MAKRGSGKGALLSALVAALRGAAGRQNPRRGIFVPTSLNTSRKSLGTSTDAQSPAKKGVKKDRDRKQRVFRPGCMSAPREVEDSSLFSEEEHPPMKAQHAKRTAKRVFRPGCLSARKEVEEDLSELPVEWEPEMKANPCKRAAEEGRKRVGNSIFEGEFVKAGKWHGWVRIHEPEQLPEHVQTKMKQMLEEKKARAIMYGYDGSFWEEDLIYLRMSDVEDCAYVHPGMAVKFKVYTDNEGVGAYDCSAA